MNESGFGRPVLVGRSIVKTFRETGEELHILNGVDLEVCAGEILAILGVSGSGKSTLLNILGTLDKCDAGEVEISGTPTRGLADHALSRLRNRHLGFVFQFHHLLPDLTAEENVALPLRIDGQKKSTALARARELLDDVGLSMRLRHRPAELSGGERQRTALARALVLRPAVVLADEPTGNLDPANAQRMFELLVGLAQRHRQTFVIATHDVQLAAAAHRRLRISEGVLTAC